MRPIASRLGWLLVGIVVAFPLVTVATPAGAWTDGPCTDTTGVTVVVDFHELGGGVSTRCAPGPVRDGFEALKEAGHTSQPAARSSGFVCRIDAKPAPTSDPCINPSPANAYWSYWVAPRGGKWCYSNLGAGCRTPPAGTVEGWSFAKDKAASAIPPPGISPPAAVPGVSPTPLAVSDCNGSSTPASRSTSTPATTSPDSPPPAAGVVPPAGVPTKPAGAAMPPSHAPTAGADTAATSGGAVTTSIAPSPAAPVDQSAAAAPATPSPTTTAEGDAVLRAADTQRADPDHARSRSNGAPVGSIVALAAIVIVGGAAGVGTRRRRSTRHSP